MVDLTSYNYTVTEFNKQKLVNCSRVLKNNLSPITRKESSAKKRRVETAERHSTILDLSHISSNFNITKLKIRFVIPMSQITRLVSVLSVL